MGLSESKEVIPKTCGSVVECRRPRDVHPMEFLRSKRGECHGIVHQASQCNDRRIVDGCWPLEGRVGDGDVIG